MHPKKKDGMIALECCPYMPVSVIEQRLLFKYKCVVRIYSSSHLNRPSQRSEYGTTFQASITILFILLLLLSFSLAWQDDIRGQYSIL